MTLLPTELVGSYAIPSWLWIARDRIEQQRDVGPTDIAEIIDDAVRIAVADQERAGLTVITDGEMGRVDFIQGFYGRLTGIERRSPARTFGAAGYDQNPGYVVVGKVEAPNGLGIVEEFARLQTMTARPTKVCVPGPLTLAAPLTFEGVGRRDVDDVFESLASIVNREMRGLVAAGAQYIQIDEPRYPTSGEDAAELSARLARTRAGVSARLGLHICFGNFRGRSRDRRDYSGLFPTLLEADFDQITLEFANRELAQIELLDGLPRERSVGLGVVDVKSYFVETPESVAASIRRALDHLEPEQVVVTTDCGLNHCPRHVASRKLAAMVEGAAIVRSELLGS